MKEDGIVMLLGAAQMTLNDLAIEMPPIEDIGTLLLQHEASIEIPANTSQIGYHPSFRDSLTCLP